ncbi:hypothetical protein ACRYLV_05415, partial [Escherichia coli]
QQRGVFSDQASIAFWALFTLHRRKLYEYRNANGVKISVKMRSPEHYRTTLGKGEDSEQNKTGKNSRSEFIF